jgi:hypothetical protein
METDIPLKDEIIIGMLKAIAVVTTTLGIFILIFFPNSTTFLAFEEPGYMFREKEFFMYENMYLDDPAVLDIVDMAKNVPMDRQPFFVVDRIEEIHNYSNHFDGVRPPSEYLKKGGVCRDTAVFYNAIFNNLGWGTQYVFPIRGHVISIVSNSNYPCPEGYKDCSIYCTIDGIEGDCVVEGDKIE